MNQILWNLLKLSLWTFIWSVFGNIPCALEKNVYSLIVGCRVIYKYPLIKLVNCVIQIIQIFFFFLSFFWRGGVFLGPHLQHMEILRPRVRLNQSYSCLPTPQPQQRRIQAMSLTYITAHGSTGSLTHSARPGIEPTFSWILVGVCYHWATTGTPSNLLWPIKNWEYSIEISHYVSGLVNFSP